MKKGLLCPMVFFGVGYIILGIPFLWWVPGRSELGWVMFMGSWWCIWGLVSVYPDSGMVNIERLRGQVSFPFFSSLG